MYGLKKDMEAILYDFIKKLKINIKDIFVLVEGNVSPEPLLGILALEENE